MQDRYDFRKQIADAAEFEEPRETIRQRPHITEYWQLLVACNGWGVPSPGSESS